MITYNAFSQDPVDLNKVSAVGTLKSTASLSSCTNKPSQLNDVAENFIILNMNMQFSSASSLQNLYTFQSSPRHFVRRMIHNYGGFAYGGLVTFNDWQEYHFVGKRYDANFVADTTASRNLGSASVTWNNIYTQNAVTVVSDRNHKTEISELTDQELQCAIACSKLYRKYKLNAAVDEKGLNAARYHIGVIAQDIVQCFTDHNLDWRNYGIITYEKWDAIESVEYQAATYDENDQELTPEIQAIEGREAGEIYMVRYDELNCFINAGLEYRLSKLE